MDFAENLKKLRKEKKVTQQQLADILCVDKTSISKWENGFNYPNQNIQLMIADYFGVSVDYLLGRDTPPPMPAPSDNTITEARLKALGVDTSQFADLSDEQLAVVRDTLTALLDSLKKSNK